VCALLDARLLTGDRGLFNDLQGMVDRQLERSRTSFVRDLVAASTERHLRYGHAGHLLEPNIRDSAGGLRDIHTIGWVSRVLPGGTGIDALVEEGNLSEIDAGFVRRARSFLLRLRIELHLLTKRHQDQLYLAEQDEIAGLLHYEALEGRPRADRLMQELFEHARQVDAVVASFWDRQTHPGRRRRWRPTRTENVGDGCVIQEGRLEVVAVTRPQDDVAGWLNVFRRTVRHDAHIGRASLNRLHESLAEGPVTWSPEGRSAFIDILQSGVRGVLALEAMDLGGLLAALIPEWQPVHAFPQRDLYHRYTVDRHLFATVAELASSRSTDERDVHDAWSRNIDGSDALFAAALLHDIGKGRPGDHSLVGSELATQIATRMGFEPDDVDDVTFLVRHHLALAETAMRRDLNDANTTRDMAERVGDERRLAMLYLLTRADALATGPEAWSSFRSSLVRELYVRTREHLTGTPVTEAPASERLGVLAQALGLDREDAARLMGPMPESWMSVFDPEAAIRQLDLLRVPLGSGEVRTAVHHADEADEFIVVAHDRPGLFATVAGVLALRGLDVHDCEIYTRSDGIAVEVFRVMGAHGAVPDERWATLSTDISSAIEGTLDLDAALSKKSAQTRRRREAKRREGAATVVLDNSVSATHTVVEVHTQDRVGLLRSITKTLTDIGCDLSIAKVATYGVQVVDVFYVRDLDNRKIEDPEELDRIRRRLETALEG
jgi:[protein-PII] uridylyltransferase